MVGTDVRWLKVISKHNSNRKIQRTIYFIFG